MARGSKAIETVICLGRGKWPLQIPRLEILYQGDSISHCKKKCIFSSHLENKNFKMIHYHLNPENHFFLSFSPEGEKGGRDGGKTYCTGCWKLKWKLRFCEDGGLYLPGLYVHLLASVHRSSR